MYLVPTCSVTLPSHPPPIFQIPQLMYLKRQSESVPKETTFSGTDSALSAGRHNGRERRVSRHRQQQPISPPSNCNKLVLCDCCVSWANYGDRDERYWGIIVSLWGRFSFKPKVTVTFRD